MKSYSLLFCLPLLVACGANDATGEHAETDAANVAATADDKAVMPPQQKRAEELVNYCSGTVQGRGLDVVETVFVQGTVDMGTDAPVLVVVQSATPGVCAHLQNNTYPKDGTYFPLALIQADGKPIAQGRTYRPSSPDDEDTDSYFTFAQLRHFGPSCSITPAAEDGMAITGQVTLDAYTQSEHIAGRYSLQMGGAREPMQGTFNAQFCDAPNLFADYMNLMNPQVDSAHCL